MACYLIADWVYKALPHRIGRDWCWQPIIPRLIAVAASCLAGVGKELFDLWQGEPFSAGDLTVDFSGALLWLFLILITNVIYKREI